MKQSNAINYLIDIFENNSDKIFVIDDISNQTLTYQKLRDEACKISSCLFELDLKKGDHVAVIMNNSISVVKLYFGCLFAGIVVVPINPELSEREIEYIINDSKVKVILASADVISKLNSELFEENNISTIVIAENFDTVTNSNNVKNLRINELKNNDFVPFTNVDEEDDLAIIYTSGTTAEPKAVIHSIADFVNNALEFGNLVGINSSHRFCNFLSLTYLGGYYNLLLLPYVCGASVVLTKAFNPKTILNFWDPIIRHKVNILWLVPSIISILLEFDRDVVGENYCKENVHYSLVGTAPLPTPLKLNFEKRYGIKIYENYGITETFFISSNCSGEKVREHCVGKILPSVKVRIVKNGQIVSDGVEGEIQVKTPFLMKGYHNTQNENVEISKEKWFETGDLGKLSNENEVFITGRKKDLIIRGGINISPVSIENIFYKHDAIRECAVIGVPHKFQGEEIIAIVTLKSDYEFNEIHNELVKLCDDNLAAFKKPSKILYLEELPHTTSGKIQKRKIVAWYLQNPIPFAEKEIRKVTPKQVFKKREFTPSKIVKESIQALSIKYNNLVYEMQKKGEDITVLSLGEAFFDIPLHSFDDLPYPAIFHYSHSRGIPELRQKIANYFLEYYDVNFDYKKEILVTAGSKIAIHMSLMTLINPGDEVIIHEPAWVSFPEQIKLCHGKSIQIPYYENVYDFEKYITEKTRVIIVNNPNNPTGRIFNLDEMSHLYNLAKKYNLYVLSDEAYSDFVENKDEFVSFANLDTEKNHTIIINSISKNFGISGWRLGYMISNENLINQALKINQHLVTCPPTILEYYVEKHFDEILAITKPQILELLRKRKTISKFMDEIGLSYLPGRSTFYFFVSISDSSLSSEEFCTLLLEKYKVSTAPGIGYGKSCEKFIRVSIGSENIERIKKGLNNIKELISKTAK